MSSRICTLQWFTGLFWLLLISFHCFLSFTRVAYVIWAVTCVSMLFLLLVTAIYTSLFYHVLLFYIFFPTISSDTLLPSLVHPLSPDSSMSTGASPLSHLLLHMPALNLFPPSSVVFWKQGHLVWRHWGSLHKSYITCQSMWDKPRCTTDPVDVGWNRPQVCCAQHKGGNVQPVAAELRQTLIQV